MRLPAHSEAKGVARIAELNQLIDAVEQDLAEDLDVADILPSMWGVLLGDGRRVPGID